MRFFVGTSGYSYKEWKGTFYPAKLPQKEMLNYYGERFSTVEINNSFYRMPKTEVLESWAAQVPEDFRFVLKASQNITHRKRLRDAEQETDYLLYAASVLGERRGPLLFQLPPNLKKDLPRLDSFLKSLQGRTAAAIEFRHDSWLDQETFDCLRSNACALCIADVDEAPAPELVSTASWGYLRLRRADYPPQQLAEWAAKIKAQPWEETYVFFKHEDSGTGPMFAGQFLEAIKA